MLHNKPEVPSPIPLTILTGFLGAGKTTMLNRILQADHGLRVAVLVNDFGAINIDSQLVVGVAEDAISLANGCICCTIRDDLLEAVLTLVHRPEAPEYIIIEASGVSDPWAVAETFLLPELRVSTRLDTIITVVDAEQVRNEFAQQPVYSALIVNQIAVADIVVLNKVDLVSQATREALQEWIRRIVPRARILESVHGHIPMGLVLGMGVQFPVMNRLSRDRHISEQHQCEHHHQEEHCNGECEYEHCNRDCQQKQHHHDHGEQFHTWSYVSKQPFALKALRDVLIALPPSIFRAKGVLFLREVPERRAILHLVGSRVLLTLGEPWGNLLPHSQLVAIGTPGGVDGAELNRCFDACLDEPVLPGEAQETWSFTRTG